MVKKQKCRLKFDQPYCTTAEGAPVICAIRHQKKYSPNSFQEASCFHLPIERTPLSVINWPRMSTVASIANFYRPAMVASLSQWASTFVKLLLEPPFTILQNQIKNLRLSFKMLCQLRWNNCTWIRRPQYQYIQDWSAAQCKSTTVKKSVGFFFHGNRGHSHSRLFSLFPIPVTLIPIPVGFPFPLGIPLRRS